MVYGQLLPTKQTNFLSQLTTHSPSLYKWDLELKQIYYG